MTGRACNGDPARLSSACSCVVSSVTSVQAVVNVQKVIVTAYVSLLSVRERESVEKWESEEEC